MRLLIFSSLLLASLSAFQASVQRSSHRRHIVVARAKETTSKEDAAVDFEDCLPWTDNEREILKESVKRHTVVISDTHSFILWRALVKSTPRLADYPLVTLVKRYQEESEDQTFVLWRALVKSMPRLADYPLVTLFKRYQEESEDPTPLYCDLLPYLDSYKFTESGDALTGVLGTGKEHTTDRLHSNAMQTLALGYVGTTSTANVQFYELGEPSKTDTGEDDNLWTVLIHNLSRRSPPNTAPNPPRAIPSTVESTSLASSEPSVTPRIRPGAVVQMGNPNKFSKPETVTVKVNDYSTIKKKIESGIFECRGKEWRLIFDPGGSGSLDEVSVWLKCLSAPVHAKVTIRLGDRGSACSDSFFFRNPSNVRGFKDMTFRSIVEEFAIRNDVLSISVQIQVAVASG